MTGYCDRCGLTGDCICEREEVVENRPRMCGGKLIDRWYTKGSGAMAAFWPTKEAAEAAYYEETK